MKFVWAGILAATTATTTLAAPPPPTPEETKLLQEFREKTRDVDMELIKANEMAEEPNPNNPPKMSADRYLPTISKLEKLEPLAAGCKEKYARLPTYDEKSLSEPKKACELASNWKTYVARHLTHDAQYTQKRITGNLQIAAKQLEEKGVFYERDYKSVADLSATLGKESKKYEEAFAKLGVEVPKEIGSGSADELSRQYAEALKKAGAVNRWPADAKHHDSEAEMAIKAAATSAGLTVLKTALALPDWEIEKNGEDIPLKKRRTGYVLASVKGESFCRIYTITASANHMGKGKYTKSTAKLDRIELDALVSTCK